MNSCLPIESDFLRRWLAAVDELTPQEAARILTRTSKTLFVEFMRTMLAGEHSPALTDEELHAVHETMCRRLEVIAGMGFHSLDAWTPTGKA